jgi:hypothetical protein
MQVRGDDETSANAARTTAAGRVAKRTANRQNEYSRRRILRRYGVT